MKRYRKWAGMVCGAAGVVLAAGALRAGSLDPTGAPGPTMYTLEDIYLAVTGDSNVVNTTSGDVVEGEILNDKKAWVKGLLVTGTMPNVGQTNMTPATSAQTIPQGYHDGTGAVAGDADLVAGNIKTNVTLFGITGTLSTNTGSAYPMMPPKTGQTTSYRTGDDGDLEKGVTLPNPRFTVTTNGTDEVVTDNMTGLMWVKAPHALSGNSGGQTWNNAIDFCNNLTFAGQSDWRLPNVRELQSLIDYGHYNLALPSGHPFAGIQTVNYWSSSTYVGITDSAGVVILGSGFVVYDVKAYTNRVWPVRGGQ